MARSRPFSQACENNKQPILQVLKQAFSDSTRVLEVASGTGQHAVYFAEHLPHLTWQSSDLEENLAGIHLWLKAFPRANLLTPILHDIDQLPWQKGYFDAIFSANSLHIVSTVSVRHFFTGVSATLSPGGRLCVYGPFNYGGNFTSESNAGFDVWLKQQNPWSGIRDVEWVFELAADIGLTLVKDHTMPANNRLLEWIRE